MLAREGLSETIQKVAESITAVMGVDIMIIDEDRAIVGTTVGQRNHYYVSKIYDYIMETKKFLIIENPGHHALCEGCRFYGNCKELVEIDAPIIVEDRCVGVLSVTAFSQERRENILRKQESYSIFLKNMAQLIAGKVGEVIANERLEVAALRLVSIIDSVNEGMIATDQEGIIIHCNPEAEKIMKIPHGDFIGKQWLDCFHLSGTSEMGQGKLRRQEATLYSADGKEINYYISVDPILDENGSNQGNIIVIEDMKNIKKLVGNIMGYNRRDFQFSDIIGKSKAMGETKNRALRACRSDSTILIRGESGTGKELFARAIHNTSKRENGPFIGLNCAAIPDSLLESELFGYEAGAFTGANKGGKPGKFELADKGTIFLDEIGDMPIYLQVKLLRVLQERSIQRIGGVKEKEIDIRVISATNKDLEKLVAENRFREDLFYRLNVIPLQIPPLRNRMEDVLELVTYFLGKYCTKLDKYIFSIEDDVKTVFAQYPWPGNVRELENVMEYALNMEQGETLTLASLPENLRNHKAQGEDIGGNLKDMLRIHEGVIISEKIGKYGKTLDAKNKIAEELGIGIATLYRKLRELGLE